MPVPTLILLAGVIVLIFALAGVIPLADAAIIIALLAIIRDDRKERP